MVRRNDVRQTWKKYFEYLCDVDKEERMIVACLALMVPVGVIILGKTGEVGLNWK